MHFHYMPHTAVLFPVTTRQHSDTVTVIANGQSHASTAMLSCVLEVLLASPAPRPPRRRGQSRGTAVNHPANTPMQDACSPSSRRPDATSWHAACCLRMIVAHILSHAHASTLISSSFTVPGAHTARLQLILCGRCSDTISGVGSRFQACLALKLFDQ